MILNNSFICYTPIIHQSYSLQLLMRASGGKIYVLCKHIRGLINNDEVKDLNEELCFL